MEKYLLLLEKIREKEKIAIAFSGGVDSTLVAYVSKQAGIEILLITLTSPLFSLQEEKLARQIAQELKLGHIVVFHPLDKQVAKNDIMRCHHCKSEEAKIWKEIAKKYGYSVVADGSNYDDIRDERRPGVKASSEHGIWHPLAEAKITKKEIRAIAKNIGLSTWNKPSNACLSSRVTFGEEITVEKLQMIEKAEDFLRTISPQLRIRFHKYIARIEVPDKFFIKICQKRKEIVKYLKKLGFVYITLDLGGYRSGSMHEGIKHLSIK